MPLSLNRKIGQTIVVIDNDTNERIVIELKWLKRSSAKIQVDADKERYKILRGEAEDK